MRKNYAEKTISRNIPKPQTNSTNISTNPPQQSNNIQKEVKQTLKSTENVVSNSTLKEENKTKINYATMAKERKVQRVNSQKDINFEMILRSGSSVEEIEMANNPKKEDSAFRISVGQKEMVSGFEKIMNDFYSQEHENHFVT